MPILALDAVARGLHSWRSREKRCRAEYRLPPQDAAAGTESFGTPRQPFWSAVASGIPRDTALRSKKTEPKLKKCLKIRCVCPEFAFPEMRTYVEPEVTRLLARVCGDFSGVRRLLIDSGFMTRESGVYQFTELGQAAWRVEHLILDRYLLLKTGV